MDETTLTNNLKNTVVGIGISIILTVLSYLVAFVFGWKNIAEFGGLDYLEGFAVATSYLCTWLCVKQTRWNYPVGIVTTLAYSILFWQFNLIALAVFNLYLVFSLAYGYWRWGSDENTKPVTTVAPKNWGWYALLALGIYGIMAVIHSVLGTEMNWVDVVVAVASGVAQFLLDNKKIETWFVWIAVNIGSIFLFATGGLYITMFQYIFFLLNAFYGYWSWKQTMEVEKDHYEESFKEYTFPNRPVILPPTTLVFD